MTGTTVTISNHDGNDYITGSASHSLTLTSLMSADATKAIISSENTDSALLGIKNNSQPSFAISVGSFTTNQIKGQQLRIYDDKVAGESISGAGSVLTWTDGGGTSVTSSVLNDYFATTDIVAGAITLGYNTPSTTGVTDSNKGTQVVFSVLYDNGEILTLYGYKNNQYYSTGHIASISYDSSLLAAPTIVVSKDATNAAVTRTSLVASNVSALKTIPEPTTATLSLLALAGLAARRRCK